MREINLPKFAGAVCVVMEDMFLKGLTNGNFKKLSEKKNYNNKKETTLITQNTYDGFHYIFKLDELFVVYRVAADKVKDQENIREQLMISLLASPKEWERMKGDGSFSMMASYQFHVSNISLLKKMMIDLDLNHFDDKYHLFSEDMSAYDFGFKSDVNLIFEAATHYKDKLDDRSDCFHKHQFGTKEVISYTSTSACVTTFILYERDTETGVIRIFDELEENVDDVKFPHDTIVIGEYPEIVKHYIENTEPCAVIENGVVVKNENPYTILRTYYNADGLAAEFEIEKKKPYDVTSLSSVMDYMVTDNINLLYTYGLWSSNSKWKKNEQGRYYIAFTDDMLETQKRETGMVHGSSDYGYISIYSSKSAMYKLPVNGEIEPEWLDLVVKSFTFVSKYHKKLPVCEAKEKDIQVIREKLLARNCI
jgi:hypothetical protein